MNIDNWEKGNSVNGRDWCPGHDGWVSNSEKQQWWYKFGVSLGDLSFRLDLAIEGDLVANYH